MNSINNKLAYIATKFYNSVRKNKTTNIIISPPCIMAMINVLLKASTGKTRRQILNTFSVLLPENHNIEKILLEILEKCEYESVLFVHSDKHVNATYLKSINKNGISTVISGEKDDLYEVMNNFNCNTEDISSIVSKPFDSILLTNVSYTGIWENMFLEYESSYFFVTSKTPKYVPYMVTSGMFGHMYCEELRSHIVDIPYIHNKYSLLLMFTDTCKNFKYLENHITSRILTTKIVFNNMHYSEISVVMPKFSVVVQHDMKSVLSSVGVTDIFGGDASMKLLSPDKISLTELYLKTRVDFINNRFKLPDQKRCNTMTERVCYIDKPFMFCIKYNKSGSILFFGKVKDPSS